MPGWPGATPSVDICEELEDWSGANLTNMSDNEEEDTVRLVSVFNLALTIPALIHFPDLHWHSLPVTIAPQSPGKYKAVTGSDRYNPDDLIIKCGDVIQLQQEDSDGHWCVLCLLTFLVQIQIQMFLFQQNNV